MTRRSLLPRTCRDFPARRPPAARPPSPATPDTPLFLRPLHSLGEIPRPRGGTTCGIALRRPSSSQATAAEPLAARAGEAPAPGASFGPASGRNNLFRPPAQRSGRVPSGLSRGRGVTSCPPGLVSLEGAAPLGESRPGQPRSSGRPGRGRRCRLLESAERGPFLLSPAGLYFAISSPITRTHGRASNLRVRLRLPGPGTTGTLPRPGAIRGAWGSREGACVCKKAGPSCALNPVLLKGLLSFTAFLVCF